MAQKNKKSKQYRTLLSVLANGSTEKASSVLKKYSGETAKDTKDLEIKLAKMYAVSPSKLDIEKEFAEIHPHKDFILKYVKVEVKPKQEPIQNNIEDLPKDTQKVILEDTASFSGVSQCGCGCGLKSNFDGDLARQQNQLQQPNQPIVDKNSVFGFVSIVAILGLVLYFSNQNRIR